jgi:hypothetical protein
MFLHPLGCGVGIKFNSKAENQGGREAAQMKSYKINRIPLGPN